jgi:hypothetical protein
LSSLNFLACASAHDDPQECSESWTISGATLVDGQEDVFMPVTLGEYRLIHSGDVKIYENLDVIPRAFLVNEWIESEDVMSSIDIMTSPDFDPQKSAVVIGLGSGMTDNIYPGTVEVLDYEAERVILSVESEMGGLLVLTDAYYPGWHATVDGQSAEIYQTDGYFRGLWVPAGSHDVEFHYEPASLPAGLVMTTLGIFGLVVLLVIGFRKRNDSTNGDGMVEIST